MKYIVKHLVIVAAMFATTAAVANDKGRIFITGDATSYGYSEIESQALLSTSDNPKVYTGTIYLKGGNDKTFKFMEEHEWLGTEYGALPDAGSTAVDGEIQLASGTEDNGYNKLFVAKDGNYLITVDTENLKADIRLSEYQDSEIKYCSLFLVGEFNKYDVEAGLPLYQSASKPYEYSATVTLKQGNFKIVNTLRGGWSWDSKYYYFRDADDEGKISTDGTGDRQWTVDEDGDYTVAVNTLANTISITKYDGSTTGIEDIAVTLAEELSPVYYNLQGIRVNNPADGIFIEVVGDSVRKVVFK